MTSYSFIVITLPPGSSVTVAQTLPRPSTRSVEATETPGAVYLSEVTELAPVCETE